MTGGSKTGGNLNSFFNSGFSDFGEVSYSVEAVYSFVVLPVAARGPLCFLLIPEPEGGMCQLPRQACLVV